MVTRPKKKAPTRPRRPPAKVIDPAKVSKKAVVDVPAPPRRGATKTTKYADAMAAVREKVGKGKSVMLAEFVSHQGAAGAKLRMLRGDLLIDGDVDEWDIEARKVVDGDGVGSRLYVTLR